MEDLKGFKPLFLVAQILGLACVVSVVVMTAKYGGGFGWRSNPGLEFNWHPLLMVIGFVYLYANSILLYRGLRNMRKMRLKVLHALIHFVVIILVIIGLTAVFDSHNFSAHPIPNLYSLHSWIGIVSVAIFGLQWILSLLAFLWPGASMPIRAAMMPWHIYLGITVFVLSIAACITGLTEKAFFTGKYSQLPAEAVLMNILGVLLILFGVVVVYMVTNPKFKRHPRPEDGSLLNHSPSE